MDSREAGNKLLALLSERLEIDPLVLDANNESALTYKDRVTLLFYVDDQRLNAMFINVPLGSAAEANGREQVMYELLSANYCWNATEGATLGLDAESGIYSLSYLVELPMNDPEQFPELIAKLINVADHWMRKIAAHSGGAVGEGPAAFAGIPMRV